MKSYDYPFLGIQVAPTFSASFKQHVNSITLNPPKSAYSKHHRLKNCANYFDDKSPQRSRNEPGDNLRAAKSFDQNLGGSVQVEQFERSENILHKKKSSVPENKISKWNIQAVSPGIDSKRYKIRIQRVPSRLKSGKEAKHFKELSSQFYQNDIQENDLNENPIFR